MKKGWVNENWVTKYQIQIETLYTCKTLKGVSFLGNVSTISDIKEQVKMLYKYCGQINSKYGIKSYKYNHKKWPINRFILKINMTTDVLSTVIYFSDESFY